MTNGLIKFYDDNMAHGQHMSIEDLIGLLDGWFEHDENHLDMNKFHHLVTEENSDDFFEEVKLNLEKYFAENKK